MNKESRYRVGKRKAGGRNVTHDTDDTPPIPYPQPEMSALAQVDPEEKLAFRCLYHVNQTRQMTRQELVKNEGNPFCPVCAPMRRMAEDWRVKKDLGR